MILVLFWGLFCNIVNTNLKEGVGRHVNCLLKILNKKNEYFKKKKKKQKHYFANKSLSSQSYGFPVVTYGCESWTIKKAEPRRIDAFEL